MPDAYCPLVLPLFRAQALASAEDSEWQEQTLSINDAGGSLTGSATWFLGTLREESHGRRRGFRSPISSDNKAHSSKAAGVEGTAVAVADMVGKDTRGAVGSHTPVRSRVG